MSQAHQGRVGKENPLGHQAQFLIRQRPSVLVLSAQKIYYFSGLIKSAEYLLVFVH